MWYSFCCVYLITLFDGDIMKSSLMKMILSFLLLMTACGGGGSSSKNAQPDPDAVPDNVQLSEQSFVYDRDADTDTDIRYYTSYTYINDMKRVTTYKSDEDADDTWDTKTYDISYDAYGNIEEATVEDEGEITTIVFKNTLDSHHMPTLTKRYENGEENPTWRYEYTNSYSEEKDQITLLTTVHHDDDEGEEDYEYEENWVYAGAYNSSRLLSLEIEYDGYREEQTFVAPD